MGSVQLYYGGADAGLEVRGCSLRRADESPPQAKKNFFDPYVVVYVTFSAFSEEEIGFVLRGFIALNNGESLSPEICDFILNRVVWCILRMDGCLR